MTCQNLIEKYSGDPRSRRQAPATVSGSASASRWLTKSCTDLRSLAPEPELVAPLRQSKSYSRINEERSAYDEKRDSYRSTIRNIYTNLKDFSSRTVSAIASDRTVRVSGRL